MTTPNDTHERADIIRRAQDEMAASCRANGWSAGWVQSRTANAILTRAIDVATIALTAKLEGALHETARVVARDERVRELEEECLKLRASVDKLSHMILDSRQNVGAPMRMAASCALKHAEIQSSPLPKP